MGREQITIIVSYKKEMIQRGESKESSKEKSQEEEKIIL